MSPLLQHLIEERLASRIWQRDTSVFAPKSAPETVHKDIANRLGWLDAPSALREAPDSLRAFAASAHRAGQTEVFLLGMGGSSLCAEVLRETANPADLRARLEVLDTTDERAIDRAAAALTPDKALFIVASKSGSTIEVSSLERFFSSIVASAAGARAGEHFIAITDPGTSLVDLAREGHYRQTFLNPPDIGGRYSALSLFGLVPAELIGLDVDRLLRDGRAMADRCRADDERNPGLALGAFMAEQARAGRDKLTILLPPSLAPLGIWIEQLIAESTGKQGNGILPVVDEALGAPSEYGADRAFVTTTAAGDALGDGVAALESAGHPVFRVDATPGPLGAEFFRWEFATAVAGAALGLNPFDEPNVRAAKAHTRTLLDTREHGQLRINPPLTSVAHLDGCRARVHRSQRRDAAGRGRYLALLDYLPVDSARTSTVARVRTKLRGLTKFATTHGLGPRYLHSTGQYHKGGSNTGLFVLLTGADQKVTPVPGTDYSFSVLKQAQALGDFEALVEADRDVIQYHFDDPAADFSKEIERVLSDQARVLV
jgi:glucose-6-phosphate isomerase